MATAEVRTAAATIGALHKHGKPNDPRQRAARSLVAENRVVSTLRSEATFLNRAALLRIIGYVGGYVDQIEMAGRA